MGKQQLQNKTKPKSIYFLYITCYHGCYLNTTLHARLMMISVAELRLFQLTALHQHYQTLLCNCLAFKLMETFYRAHFPTVGIKSLNFLV